MRTTIAPSTIAIILSVALGACSRPPEIVGEPVLTMNPGGRTPLAGRLELATDRPARITLVIGDGDNSSTTVTPSDEVATEHSVMVLGLKPDRLNTIDVIAVDAAGLEAANPRRIEVRTPPLPEAVPPVQVTARRTSAMEPGVTLVPLFRWQGAEIDREYGLILALDAEGDVVWVCELPHSALDAIPLANGNILYNAADAQGRIGYLYEIDMLGNVVQRWHTTGTPKNDVPPESVPIDTDTLHHDIVEMPSGNFLALSTEVRVIENFPADEMNPNAPPKTRPVIGDVLLEFQRDGAKVREWKLFDLLDTGRIGFGSTNVEFYKLAYEGVLDEPAPDWMHANGIFYDAATDTALISSNYLSVVTKLDLKSNRIVWLLGNHEDWRAPWSDLLLQPKGELLWSWHHHAPRLTPAGTILLYDNGPIRQRPPMTGFPNFNESFSRAVEYRVDEANRTVEQIWAFGGPGSERFFSGFVSEADRLPQTGNILLTNGGHVRLPDGGQGFPGQGHHWISLAEVTHTTPTEKVWGVIIDHPAASWSAFRGERIPSLYR
jgi:arylsulfate sulfotransferase